MNAKDVQSDMPSAEDWQASDYVDRITAAGAARQLENFGLMQMSVDFAAELLAVDMWSSGKVPGVDEPAQFQGDRRDPRLLAQLRGITEIWKRRLVAAIERGSLQTAILTRGLDDEVVGHDTFLAYGELSGWLMQRGYVPGDALNEWMDSEQEIIERVWDEVDYLQTTLRSRGPAAQYAALTGRLRAGRVD